MAPVLKCRNYGTKVVIYCIRGSNTVTVSGVAMCGTTDGQVTGTIGTCIDCSAYRRMRQLKEPAHTGLSLSIATRQEKLKESVLRSLMKVTKSARAHMSEARSW